MWRFLHAGIGALDHELRASEHELLLWGDYLETIWALEDQSGDHWTSIGFRRAAGGLQEVPKSLRNRNSAYSCSEISEFSWCETSRLGVKVGRADAPGRVREG